MSQSKLSITDDTEKKFVMKHIFKDVKNLIIDGGDEAEMSGPVEEHFGVEWKLRIQNCHSESLMNFNQPSLRFYLDCLQTEQSSDWRIETKFYAFVRGKQIGGAILFYSKTAPSNYTFIGINKYPKYTTNDEMHVEFQVTVKKMTGIEEKKKLKNFDDDSAKDHSDVMLKIGDQKFYVNKMYLASHSSYFESLFSGNFSESQKSEIELKDIDAQDFQHFLELIHGYSLVKGYTVMGILKLADFFDAPCATQRCEEFLLNASNQSLKFKFHTAVKYKLDDLKKQCLSQMNEDTNFIELSPENADDFSPADWKMLFDKVSSYH